MATPALTPTGNEVVVVVIVVLEVIVLGVLSCTQRPALSPLCSKAIEMSFKFSRAFHELKLHKSRCTVAKPVEAPFKTRVTSTREFLKVVQVLKL